MTFPPALGFWSTLTWPYETPWNQSLPFSKPSFLCCFRRHAQAPGCIYKTLLLPFHPLTHWLLRPRRQHAHRTCNSPPWFLRTDSVITLQANKAQLHSTIFLENSIKSHSSRHSWMLGTQETISPSTNQNTSPETECRSDLSPQWPCFYLLAAVF